MKKILFIIGVLLLFDTTVFATCPLDSKACSITAFDESLIRAPFKPIYNEYDGNADFGSDPFVRLSPAQRQELDRNFQLKNGAEVQSNPYNSDCQFGVCLPDRNRFN